MVQDDLSSTEPEGVQLIDLHQVSGFAIPIQLVDQSTTSRLRSVAGEPAARIVLWAGLVAVALSLGLLGGLGAAELLPGIDVVAWPHLTEDAGVLVMVVTKLAARLLLGAHVIADALLLNRGRRAALATLFAVIPAWNTMVQREQVRHDCTACRLVGVIAEPTARIVRWAGLLAVAPGLVLLGRFRAARLLVGAQVVAGAQLVQNAGILLAAVIQGAAGFLIRSDMIAHSHISRVAALVGAESRMVDLQAAAVVEVLVKALDTLVGEAMLVSRGHGSLHFVLQPSTGARSSVGL